MPALSRAVCLLVLASCARGFDVPVPVLQPAGVACTAASHCASNICADGVCCSATCSPSQVCNAPGSLGACTSRALGASCAGNAQCPGAHCVDGVCCDTACTATCNSCALPGHAGTCSLVPDNQDPRKACGAACTACFQGQCAPALAGTDPTASCTNGAVCGTNQTCGKPEGASCASDSECALGSCIAGDCRSTLAEEVTGNPLIAPTSTTSRRPVSIAGSYRGEITALIDESTGDGAGGYFEADLYAMTRDVSGAWTGVDLMTDRFGEGGMAAAVEYLGTTAFVALYNHQSAAQGCPAGTICGIYGVLVAPHSPPSPPETISAAARNVAALRLAVDAKGALFLAWLDSSTQVIHLLQRTVGSNGPGWNEIAQYPTGFPTGDAGYVAFDFALDGGAPRLVAADAFVANAIAFAGTSTTPTPATWQTCPSQPHISIASGNPGETLVGFSCSADIAYFGLFAPPSFSLTLLPSRVTDVGSLLHTVQGPLLYQLENVSGGTLADEVHLGWLPPGQSTWADHFAWKPRGQRSVYLIAAAISHSGNPLAIAGVVPAGVTNPSPTQVYLLH